MGVRLEKVVLEIDDGDFGTRLAKDAVQAAALGRELDLLDERTRTSTTSLKRGTTALGKHSEALQKDTTATTRLLQTAQQVPAVFERTSRSSTALARDLDRNGRALDSYTGRLSALAQVGILIGPGVIPAAAATLPLLAALTTGLTAAVLAGGSAVLAFNGVGDSLEALNAYQLEPTPANLEKLREEFERIGPAGADFVTFLDDIEPQLRTLQDTARAGVLPGVQDGIQAMLDELPRFRDLLREASTTTGDLFADTGASLAGDDFRGFFDYLQRDGVDTFDQLARSAGNFGQGAANVLAGLGPLTRDVSGGLLEISEGFADATADLDDSATFQEFLAYIRDTGPQVIDTAGAVAGALSDVVEAAAPLGGPVLQGIEILAETISTVADTPLGPFLFTAAAGATLLNRSLSLTTGLLSKVGVASAAAARQQGTQGQLAYLQGAAGQARTSARQIAGDLGTVIGGKTQILAKTQAELDRTRAATDRLKGSLGGVGRASAGLAGLAVVASGTADGLGLTNTATGALLGTIAGPWGAAIGGGAGLLLDLRDAANLGREALEGFDAAISDSSSVSEYAGALAQLEAQIGAIGDNPISGAGLGAELIKGQGIAGGIIDPVLGAISDVGGGDENKTAIEGASQAADQLDQLSAAASALADAQGMASDTTAELDAALLAASPAMDALGLNTRDLIQAAASGGLDRLVAQVEQYQRSADSGVARTHAFADSVAALGNDATSTAASAENLRQALNNLINPNLDNEAATDAWHDSLQRLRAELESDAGFKGFGEAAQANRAITRDYATDSIERLSTLAGVTTTTQADMAKAVADTRREFIRSGIAAGFDRKEIEARANALGLTPAMVKTVFDAVGIDKAELDARALAKAYKTLPPSVRTELRADGIPTTAAQVDKLVEKYKLSEKQRRALLTLVDRASGGIKQVLDALGLVDRQKPNPRIDVQTSAALGAIGGLTTALNNIDDESVFINVYRQYHGGSLQGQKDNPALLATGGPVVGPGGPTDDVVPIWASNGEWMMRAAAVQKYGRKMMHDINTLRFRDGGEITTAAARRAGDLRSSTRVNVAAPSLAGLQLRGQITRDAAGEQFLDARIVSIATSVADQVSRDNIAADAEFDYRTGGR